jgi:hypothetical protein
MAPAALVDVKYYFVRAVAVELMTAVLPWIWTATSPFDGKRLSPLMELKTK